ncbi:MAG: ABC transporter permease subunit [Clostridia bacterium]|nr:ABC transporter permease subunit [Clostridia bacterium]
MLAIYKREMRSYFTGVIGYVFLVLFLAIGGGIFCLTTLYAMTSNVTAFFTYMLIFSAVILPLLTMKSFSDERKAKTEQLLLTAPVSITSMVLGKFLAAMTMFGGALLVNSLYFLILYNYANVKTALLIGNFVALLLVGMTFISVGIFVSALTENQLTAAVGTMGIILLFLGVGVVNSLLPANFWLRYVLDCISVFTRFQTFVNGYFDLSSVVYYISVSAVFVYLTIRVYDRRRYN